MPEILAVYARDAFPIIRALRSKLGETNIAFLEVDYDLTPQKFLEASGDTRLCLIFFSKTLVKVLRPLMPLAGEHLFLNPRITAWLFNLSSWPVPHMGFVPPYNVAVVASDIPLLRMTEAELDKFLDMLVSALQKHFPADVSSTILSAREPDTPTLHRTGSDPAVELLFATDPELETPPSFDPRVVELLFATNRAPAEKGAETDFGGERADALSFGACRVRVPDDHKIGQLELPKKSSWIRLRFNDEKLDERLHFALKEISRFDETTFLDMIKGDHSHTALIFVHGFNTSFRDGVLRLGQIIWDMQFKGIPILFSWPSAGRVLDYLYDFNSALDARRWFGRLIQMISAEGKVETLHIIAHSMGNLVVLDTLNNLANAGTLPRLSEIVMAAPDVDIDLYKILASNIRPLTRGMTLYASANDKALVLSRRLAGKPRAGDVFSDGPIILPNIEAIDVSAIGEELFGLNHNAFADNRSLIDDIGRVVLSGERPPNQRSPQIRCVPEGMVPPHYWRYAR